MSSARSLPETWTVFNLSGARPAPPIAGRNPRAGEPSEDRHHHAPRARELFRHAPGIRVHPDIPRSREPADFLSRRLLRARPGGPGAVLRLPPLAVSVPDSCGLHGTV